MNRPIRTIRRLADHRRWELSDDENLLDQFLARRDQDAFAELVRRHGPMVLGVGRACCTTPTTQRTSSRPPS